MNSHQEQSDNSTRLLMGNEAIALGAIRAGVDLVAGYPGTPSTEVLQTIAKQNQGQIYVEWSVNEKAALEVAAGAAYAGARTLVTMKQVGLNVASDPLMSLAYVGIKGGMVVLVADDPGPISSQTEQDTRHFAAFAKLPVFDPSSPEEAYLMIAAAFTCSEKYGVPVIFRPTTRLCHGCASIKLLPPLPKTKPTGFVKDSKWVIFPRLAYNNHLRIEEQRPIIAEEFSQSPFNLINGSPSAKKGVACGGVSYEYICENYCTDDYRLFKVATPHPFPEQLALNFLEGLDEVLCIEELDPVIEDELLKVVAKYHLPVTIKGKRTNSTRCAGENSVESVYTDICRFMGWDKPSTPQPAALPALPVRPPVLCAGCPHRASFYAVKQACKGKEAVFCGDIGCYTLGNAPPLHMVDTCLCMGADVTIAQGLQRINPAAAHFAFIGDSTFFASGITGVVNAVHNQTDIILIVLDNSTTAMTGHQSHPGTGRTMMGATHPALSIEKVLAALDIKFIRTVDPLNLEEAISTVQEALVESGVRAVIFRSPCIAIIKPGQKLTVDPKKCIGCMCCIKEIGCPALIKTITDNKDKAFIDPNLCTGCSLCAQICKLNAIGGEDNE